MAIFPNLELERVVQVGDKTRLNGVKSFISKGQNPVTVVKIKPEAAGSFITVTGTSSKDWFLDWIYDSAGVKTATIEITTDTTPTTSPETISKNFTIEVLSAADDKLFSDDKDLIEYESDVLKYVRDGRNSWLDYHRKAQELIVAFFDERGNVTANQEKISKVNFADVEEVREWSTVLTLRLIYEHLSTQGGEAFKAKAVEYQKQELERRNRVVVRLDLDGDAEVSLGEYLQPTTVRLLRR